MLFFSDIRQHRGFFRWLWLLLYGSEMLRTCWGISVSFPYSKPIFVAPGKMLVLQAQVKRSPTEVVRLVTWDFRNGKEELRLYTDKTPDPDKVRWQVNSVADGQYGVYIVTVTDSNGDQASASADVRKSNNPPNASLSLQCIMEPEGTMWDSPVFSWWENGIQVTNQTGPLSSDGSRLHLSGSLSSNYTCVITSSQGTSTMQIIREAELDSEPHCSSCSVSIAVAVIEGIGLAIVGILFWRLHVKWKKERRRRPDQSDGQS